MELIKATTTMNNNIIYINPDKVGTICEARNSSGIIIGYDVTIDNESFRIKENIIEIYNSYYKKFYEEDSNGYSGCVIE